MNYLRADVVLPEELLVEIQKYVEDGLIYIPKPKILHKKWGELTGSKRMVEDRNKQIKLKFQIGSSIEYLSKEYSLSIDTIKKIVYKKSS